MDQNEDPNTEKKLEELGERFTLQFLEAEFKRHPENVTALSELANLYTKLGRYEDGLRADLRLVSLNPDDPIVHYNLACSYARLAHTEEAIASLTKAIELGYADQDFLLQDEDLKSLHHKPEFQKLISKLSKT